MFRNLIAVGVSLLALGASAITLKRSNSVEVAVASVEVDAEGLAFDYSHHGQDWIQGVCSSRERQSPINFADLTAPVSGKLSYSYQSIQSSFEVANNGHSISADLMGLGYGGITYENSWYNLMNINFHAVSEHTFMGQHLPLEMHFVHKKYDSDALLVVAVPFNVPGFGPAPAPAPMVMMQEEVEQPAAVAPAPAPAGAPGAGDIPYVVPTPGNLALQKFVNMAPPAVNQKATAIVDETSPLDLNEFLAGGQFFEYAGSLTAPPCAEVATWFVRRNPLAASPSQVAALRDALFGLSADFGNYRSVMPLNGRPIAVRQGVKEEPPPQAPVSIPQGKNPKTDREYRAIKMSRDALKVAKAATDYVRGLDSRLRDASAAHAAVLGSAGAPAPAPAAGPVLNPGVVAVPPVMGMDKVAADASMAIASAAETAIQKATKEITEAATAAAKTAAPLGPPSIATPLAAR